MSWLPGWTSIESTARWEEFFFWLGIVFLVLVRVNDGLMLIPSHVLQNRMDRLNHLLPSRLLAWMPVQR